MIIGIGVDTVNPERCKEWFTFADKQLAKWLTPVEIVYCKRFQAQAAERFAARLACKEAFYKAFSSLNITNKTLFEVSRAVEVQHAPSGAPELKCDWSTLLTDEQKNGLQNLVVHVSISHTKEISIAMALLESV